MVIKRIIFLFLIIPILASCSTTGQVRKQTLLYSLPDKKPVNINSDSLVKKPKTLYDKAKTKAELSLLKQTPSPIRIQPVIAKVLILPYTDSDDVLHSCQYVFLKLTKGRWLLGSYLYERNIPRLIQPLIDAVPSSATHNNISVKNNSGKPSGFFAGGKPKQVYKPLLTPSENSSNNRTYFTNTVNAIKR